MDFKKSDVSGEYGGTQSASIAIKYCTVKENKVFELTTQLPYTRYNDLQFDIDEESDIFNQMISTFKFID